MWFNLHSTLQTCSRKDTGQRVDPALYGFQDAPLRSHVLLGGHGNAKEKTNRVKWSFHKTQPQIHQFMEQMTQQMTGTSTGETENLYSGI